MWAAKDSEECLSRNWCAPIGSSSVWSTPSYNISQTDGKPLIVVSAKFDSTAFIHPFALGTGQKTGVVALLAIAKALQNAPQSMAALQKHVVFTLFNVESYGLSGSSRFVQDISTSFKCKKTTDSESSKVCPFDKAGCVEPCQRTLDFTKLNFDQIESIIELDTLGNIHDSDSATQYYMHSDYETTLEKGNVDLMARLNGSFVASNTTNATPLTLSSAFVPNQEIPKKLPPSSSLMSFLLKKRNIPGVVISDYQFPFSNPYYNSELDNGNKWTSRHVESICGLASYLARQIYSLSSGVAYSAVPGSVAVNCSLVNEWMTCLTRNLSCSLVSDLVNGSYASKLFT